MSPALSSFREAAFMDGTNGVGYDRGSDYSRFITTDVESVMHDQQALVYLRIPFEVPSPRAVMSLELAVKYDDAYVAYLNGQPIVNRGMAFEPSVDSEPFYFHSDSLAVEDAVVDLTSSRDLLVAGTNWLAIGGLNESEGSSDFLIAAHLRGQVAAAQSQSDFAAWLEAMRPPQEASDRVALGDDPDGDGYVNESEYLLGSDPWRAASVPSITYSGGGLRFQGRGTDEGITYLIEQSATLMNDWEPTEHTVSPQLDSLPNGVVVYRGEVPLADDRQFYRVRAVRRE